MQASTSPDDVLDFWLGPPGGHPLALAKLWFTKDEAFDHALRERFQATLEAGVRGELSHWQGTPRGRLALIILFDQFSRNMFRGSPRSFAQDALALGLARALLSSDDYRVLSPLERSFVLLPLMHAEDLPSQRQCIAGFETLVAEASEELAPYFANNLDYAKRHEAIIARFGRFPHRNVILGRESTPEEIDFLKQPGSSF